MADIPEESNVDTESDGLGLGEYKNDLEEYSDGDHEKDEDYVDTQAPNQPESEEEQDDLEFQEEVSETARKQKKKVSSSLDWLQITN